MMWPETEGSARQRPRPRRLAEYSASNGGRPTLTMFPWRMHRSNGPPVVGTRR